MGWIAAGLMGFVLGLLGGGGGILTVPILVSLFALPATQATGASLFIVGVTSLAGAAQGLWKREADIQAALTLAVPSALGAWLARKFIVPSIPKEIGSIHRDELLLGLFVILMVIVATRMLRPSAPDSSRAQEISLMKTAIAGFAVGLVSGFLGAGGGFLIVPVLTLLLGVEFKRAIPTSLLVIAIQSLVGFSGELGKPIPFELLFQITGIALVGMGLGLALRSKVTADKLKRGFAILILVVAAAMALQIVLNRF